MTASRIVLYFCLSFIGGIFLNSIINISQVFQLGFIILGILLISPFWSHKKFVVIGFCILFLVLGIWRHQVAESEIINNELRKYNDVEQTFSFFGKIIKEPDVRDTNTKLTIGIEGIKGKVLVTTNKYPEYQYGDIVKITGELETPIVFEDFNYRDYLAKDGIYSVSYWPKIELVEKNQGLHYQNFGVGVYTKILDFKNKLRESIYQNLSPPQSSILGAMILGDKSRMSEDLKERLNIAGVRHITAVSGLHVAILTTVLMTLLLGLGFWRKQAFYFSIILITLFIIMTGLQPSAIRAGIMGGLFLLAQYLGRLNVSSRAIVFAAAIMLVVNPLLLRLDVGFQLSFLAILGIIYLMPNFQNWLKFIPSSMIKNILAMTFSAYIFTLPLLIYNFGYISLVAPITNLLIIPLLYLIMILGFIFALFGIIFQPLGWILSLPAWILLSYVIVIINYFSQSWAVKTFENVHWIWLIISYLILGLITWRFKKRRELRFLKY